MADVFTPEERSRVMSKIRGKDTAPELAVRTALWHRGVRYRTHVDDVPGTPDIAHKGARVAVFIDGCFWHGCPECHSLPATNREFWREKVRANKERRQEVRAELIESGWTVFEIWECRLDEDLEALVGEIADAILNRRPEP